jgi:cytochrome c peroxidase
MALLSASAKGAAADEAIRPGEPVVPLSRKDFPEKARAQLGERLFGDVRLSGGGRRSCASCHDLDSSGADAVPQPSGPDGAKLPYNTPTIFNATLNFRFNWRGNYRDLESLIGSVIVDEKLMAAKWEDVIAALRADEDYPEEFEAAYRSTPRSDLVVDALASFIRTLITVDAPFDRYLRGDREAIAPRQVEGFRLFKEYGCAACHQGANVGGNLFQRFGIFEDAAPRSDDDEFDLGRFTLTKRQEDLRVFRVPSLRNIEETPPYFHDGRTETLGQAIDAMARSQLGRVLSQNEIELIADFLRSLTGRWRERPLSRPRP